MSFNIKHLFAHNSIVFSKWLNSCIWPQDGTLTCTTILGQSGPWSNGNEEALHIPQSSKTRASLSDILVTYPEHLLGGS